jgi:hypothetical protein
MVSAHLLISSRRICSRLMFSLLVCNRFHCRQFYRLKKTRDNTTVVVEIAYILSLKIRVIRSDGLLTLEWNSLENGADLDNSDFQIIL